MLLTLGLDSMFGTLEGALTSINDMMLFPKLRKEILCGLYEDFYIQNKEDRNALTIVIS